MIFQMVPSYCRPVVEAMRISIWSSFKSEPLTRLGFFMFFNNMSSWEVGKSFSREKISFKSVITLNQEKQLSIVTTHIKSVSILCHPCYIVCQLVITKCWSKQCACAALGRCMQNVVATINSIFSLYYLLLGLLFSKKRLSWFWKY